uniref:PilZ domain-containing protein n=1 Tax=Anopheles maculatus TaxID=74869 RepID=A0A182SQW6_9DIPT
MRTETIDLSMGGVSLKTPDERFLDDPIEEVELALKSGTVSFPVEVINVDKSVTRLMFQELPIEKRRELVRVVLARADAWIREKPHAPDRPLRSFLGILRCIFELFYFSWQDRREKKRRKQQIDSSQQPGAVPGSAEQTVADSTSAANSLPQSVTPQAVLNQSVESTLSITDMGQPSGLTLNNWQRQSGITFTLPSDSVVTAATLLLDVEVSPALMEGDAELHLMLNGQPLSQHLLNKLHQAKVTYKVAVPAAMVVAHNNLSFSIKSDNDATMQCEKGASDKYWVKVLPSSHLQLEGQ